MSHKINDELTDDIIDYLDEIIEDNKELINHIKSQKKGEYNKLYN